MAQRGPIPLRGLLADDHTESAGPLGPPVSFATIATVATFVFAYVAYVLLENRFPDEALEIWRRWDTVHYVHIARDGYGTDPERVFLIMWPPLYPWLMRGFRWLPGSYLGAGLFISFVSYLAAVIGLYRLVGLDFPRDTAMRAVIYISIFPAAYFFHAAYTEALFSGVGRLELPERAARPLGVGGAVCGPCELHTDHRIWFASRLVLRVSPPTRISIEADPRRRALVTAGSARLWRVPVGQPIGLRHTLVLLALA